MAAMKRLRLPGVACQLGLVAALTILLVAAASPRRASRRLTPGGMGAELRAAVERLKVEAQDMSTDREVQRTRLETLGAWADALAISGCRIPVDFPLSWGACYREACGTVETYSEDQASGWIDEEGHIAAEAIAEFIRRSVRELRIKEEQPTALGTLTLSDQGPFQVTEPATVLQTYTMGDMPMVPGGGFMVANTRRTSFQTADPTDENYLTVSCSKPDAVFEKVEPWGLWESFLTHPLICYRLTEGRLERGDSITVTYGDTTGGSPGYIPQHGAVDRLRLPFFVDLEGDATMMAPAWPTYGLIGLRETAFVNAVAPSIVTPDEPFALAVRSEDIYKNPVSGQTPEYQVLLEGAVVATVPPRTGAVSVINDLRIPEPGVHRFQVRSVDGRLVALSNPIWVRESPGRRIYWGDTHGHIGFADGQGSPHGYFRYGRDVARLDFLSLSEHDIWTDAREWQDLRQLQDAYTDPGRFTALLGYEWTASVQVGGHHNVYFRQSSGGTQVSHNRVLDLEALYQGLRAVYRPEDVLIIPHAHMPGDWRMNDAEMERVVEIQSGHGTFEWFGDRYLENGFRVGFIGSSDNHHSHPGYSPSTNRQLGGLAAVLAAENTQGAIFDALRDRSCYATTGERIILDADLDGIAMGRELDCSGTRTIACRAVGTEPIDAIDVVKNGEIVYTRRYLTPALEPEVRVQVLFTSSNEMLSYAQPPARRNWRGSIEVTGARLVAFERPWFAHSTSDLFARDPDNPNRIDFYTTTRGRGKAVILQIAEATPDSRIEVELRPISGLPGAELGVSLGALMDGPAVGELQDGEYVDTVQAQLVPGDAALDQVFSYTDLEDLEPDDTYYLRVRQVDGSMAWSSPWFCDE